MAVIDEGKQLESHNEDYYISLTHYQARLEASVLFHLTADETFQS